MTIQDLIQQAKKKGFEVYAPEKLTSYFYFSKDDKVGYAQLDRMTGPSFSTVHKPNKSTGTGYKVGSFSEALCFKPMWACSRDVVVKYDSLSDFLKKHWQPLVAL